MDQTNGSLCSPDMDQWDRNYGQIDNWPDCAIGDVTHNLPMNVGNESAADVDPMDVMLEEMMTPQFLDALDVDNQSIDMSHLGHNNIDTDGTNDGNRNDFDKRMDDILQEFFKPCVGVVAEPALPLLPQPMAHSSAQLLAEPMISGPQLPEPHIVLPPIDVKEGDILSLALESSGVLPTQPVATPIEGQAFKEVRVLLTSDGNRNVCRILTPTSRPLLKPKAEAAVKRSASHTSDDEPKKKRGRPALDPTVRMQRKKAREQEASKRYRLRMKINNMMAQAVVTGINEANHKLIQSLIESCNTLLNMKTQLVNHIKGPHKKKMNTSINIITNVINDYHKYMDNK